MSNQIENKRDTSIWKEANMRRSASYILMSVFLLAAGCGSLEANSGQGVGEPAPSFVQADLNGIEHSLDAYQGQVVVLDFWATWCGPCVRAGPIIQNLHDRFGDRGVVVLSVQIGDPSGDAAAYVAEHGYTFAVLPHADAMSAPYEVVALPTMIIIDREGNVAHRQEGLDDEAGFAARIESLLGS
jgi:thiol-disulfide isomerase/thioredoxin